MTTHNHEKCIIELFRAKFPTIIDTSHNGKALSGMTSWCYDRFGIDANGQYDSFEVSFDKRFTLGNPHGLWDYAVTKRLILFGFMPAVSDNDLVEFKLRFG